MRLLARARLNRADELDMVILLELLLWAVQMQAADVQIERVQYQERLEARHAAKTPREPPIRPEPARRQIAPDERAAIKDAVEHFVRERPGELINLRWR